MKRLKIAGIGCGGRTLTYCEIAGTMPERYQVVAAADPNPVRVEKIRQVSRNPEFRGFDSDKSILAVDRLADIMIIGTQDAYHVEPCIAAMEKGYDILLEKPIATSIDEVVRLEKIATKLGRKVLVCHVLRYTPFYCKVKEIVESGMLGDIISLNATEGVGHWHQAHSFVRGHWGVAEQCTPMIIAKSCHDLDIIRWVVDRPCRSVSSSGALTYFTKKNMPAGAPKRCTEGCPVGTTCPYNALRYATQHRGWLGWVYDHAQDASLEQITEWLSKSPWGRCVYQCDNTAVDHQTVSLLFEGDVTATFTMTAFEAGRNLEIFGTKARLHGGEFVKSQAGADIIVIEHEGGVTKYNTVEMVGGYSGHGGGDPALVLSLYDEMMKERPDEMRSSLTKSVESHLMGFAAEEARITGRTVDLARLR
jgi:predicted dehydrogenase